MISLDDFQILCNKKNCLRNTILSNQCDKEHKQKSCYTKYILKQEKDKIKKDEKYQKQREEYIEKCINKDFEIQDERWEELRKEIFIRDKGECQFYSKCSDDEKIILNSKLWGKMKTLDCAHVFPKGSYPNMKYEQSNIFLLYRYVHFCLDNYLNPFTEEKITKEEVQEFWKRMIGEQTYAELQEMSTGRKNV